ncbi:hypothetical protein EGW08_022396 [Elysia chlorotica]|uniref:SRCR domain-containing protein n=1 Tax=Elysia chlorotica TaxID=188477 RepID=A0A433SL41_ELYCH|nr:hypothetical protein EGW08_022396 [Elysia chlorotica]
MEKPTLCILSSRWAFPVLFLVLSCLCQLSQASPRSSTRFSTNILSEKIPRPLPPIAAARNGPYSLQRETAVFGDISKLYGALRLSEKIPRPLPPIAAARNGRFGDISKLYGALRSVTEDTETAAGEGEDGGSYYGDEDIYELAHFWDQLVGYAEALVYDINSTLTSELTEFKYKVEELESSLAEKDEEILSLREALEELTLETRAPSLGDVRLLHQEGEGNDTTGVLMFYAGGSLEWGYVCDDMFSNTAATVACKQLGYARGQVDETSDATFNFDLEDRKRPIVLDDVVCSNGDADLLSCEHIPVGVHNCGLSEAVSVKCSR